MASTIILKNGTGEAPSTLTQGEVAINTATGIFYFGAAEGEISELHRFNNVSASGHITASGDISASGDIYASSIISKGTGTFSDITGSSVKFTDTKGIYADKIRRASDSDNTTKILLNDEVIKFNAGDSSNETLKLSQNLCTITGDVTASLNVSGSGTGSFTAGVIGRNLYRSYYRFMGFNIAGTADTVYEFSATMQDTKAPWEHDQDHHATITTAMDVSDYFSAGGHIMPHGGTITKIRGWAHTNGTSAEHKLALVRLRPTEDDNSDVNPVLIDEITWTSLGNDKLKSINETLSVAVNAGDMLMTMIKDNTGGRTIYFNITVELSSDS